MKNRTDRKNSDLRASITKDGNRRTLGTSDNLLEGLSLCRKHWILPEPSAGTLATLTSIGVPVSRIRSNALS
jgi:hypothetical protein